MLCAQSSSWVQHTARSGNVNIKKIFSHKFKLKLSRKKYVGLISWEFGGCKEKDFYAKTFILFYEFILYTTHWQVPRDSKGGSAKQGEHPEGDCGLRGGTEAGAGQAAAAAGEEQDYGVATQGTSAATPG